MLGCFAGIIWKHAISGILGLLCAEQNVGNLKKCTFRNSGTPVRRAKRRKSQEMDFQEFWDSCAQNKTSEISRNGLSGILGLLCAEQNVGNIKHWTFKNYGSPRRTSRRKSQKMDFQELWDSCAQNKMSEISNNKHIWAHMGDTFRTHRTHLEHIWNAWSTLRHIWEHLW